MNGFAALFPMNHFSALASDKEPMTTDAAVASTATAIRKLRERISALEGEKFATNENLKLVRAELEAALGTAEHDVTSPQTGMRLKAA